jgi:hypothetical protein
MESIDETLFHVARRQLELVTRGDVLGAGGTDRYIATKLVRRAWIQLHPGVYLTGSGPPTWMQKMLAACLAAGPRAVASHRGGAAVWWLDGTRESLVEITAAVPCRPMPRSVVVHRTRRWEDVDRTVYRGIPVTSVNRTLLDYAAVVPRLLVARAVEDAIRRGLTNEGALRRRIAQIGGPGVRGTVLLRDVLDSRPKGRPARSGFEVMTLDLMLESGFPMPVRRHPVRDETGLIVAELDLAYPEKMVGIEPGGDKWHSTEAQVRRDEERKVLLRRLGWNITDLTWDMVVHHPALAVAAIRRALRASTRA